MSYTSNKNILSSTGVAVLASLGIHGLLWAVLPGLTTDSQANKSPSQRTIGLVQLSPQEQSRLPQVSNPVDNNLPAFATGQSQLPPLPPAPPYQTSVIPPLQLPPGINAPVSNVASDQNSAPPPQTYSVPLPPPPNTSFPPIPNANQFNSYPMSPVPQTQPYVLPPNNGLPDTRLNPDRTLPPDDNIATATPFPQPSPQPIQANPNTIDNPSITANKLPERGKKELLAMRDSMRNNFPPSAATSSPNTRSMSRQEIAAALRGQQSRSNQITPPPTNTRSMSRQEIAAALRGQQSRSNQITPPPTNTRSMSREQLIVALRGQTRNPSNEPSEETKIALNNIEKFKHQQAIVQAQNPNAVTKPPIRRKLTTCDRAIDGDVAVVNVVVNPEGKRLSEPNLITKNGKPDVVQAQNYVRNYEFAKTGKTTNYNFRLEFDYVASKCAQAQPTPSPTPNVPTPLPTTTSTPEPTRSIPTPSPTNSNSTHTPTRRMPALTPTPSPESTITPQPTPLPIDSKKPSF